MKRKPEPVSPAPDFLTASTEIPRGPARAGGHGFREYRESTAMQQSMARVREARAVAPSREYGLT